MINSQIYETLRVLSFAFVKLRCKRILLFCFQKVTVIVNDVNDNTPQFINPPQSTHVSEAARPESNVIQVSAKDEDLGFAGKVVYNITGGNTDGT